MIIPPVALLIDKHLFPSTDIIPADTNVSGMGEPSTENWKRLLQVAASAQVTLFGLWASLNKSKLEPVRKCALLSFLSILTRRFYYLTNHCLYGVIVCLRHKICEAHVVCRAIPSGPRPISQCGVFHVALIVNDAGAFRPMIPIRADAG